MYGLVEALMELLRIPSVAGDGEGCGKALDYIIDKGESFSFACSKWENGRVGIIEMGEGEETLGIFTHVDVSDPGNLNMRQNPPFDPAVDRGRIIGRGAVDNKGPALAVLFAMKDVWNMGYQRGIPFKRKIRLIVGTDNESGNTAIKKYLRENGEPDYGFTPDGRFPVMNTGNGSMSMVLSFPVRKEKACIRDISTGDERNTMPGSCRITLMDEKRFEARGRAVLYSYPEQGSNAIFNMAAALDSLKGNDRLALRNDSIFRVMMKLKYGFEDAGGQLAGMPRSSGSYKGEAAGRNIFVPTRMYVRDDRIFVEMSVSYGGETTEESIVSAMEYYFRDADMRIDDIDSSGPFLTSRNMGFVRILSDAYEKTVGMKCDYGVSLAPTYAQNSGNLVVFGPALPDSVYSGHMANENISVRDLTTIESIYEKAIRNMAYREDSLK